MKTDNLIAWAVVACLFLVVVVISASSVLSLNWEKEREAMKSADYEKCLNAMKAISAQIPPGSVRIMDGCKR